MALHSSRLSAPLCGIALCAGYGGLELGLHIAEPRYRTVCFVEREAHAAAALVTRMEDEAVDRAPVWDDVKSFDGRPWRGRVHILTAGYPCQPFSSSGRRRGTKDPRHLWPDVARIVGEAEPEWVFLENVLGHLDLGFSEVGR
ncbi:MAG: DNA cytosine methyltransferase, partial [Bacteroidetes bacterium]|nr:DNA cytosine methyltransferase [Bacteroidota bacterium]